MRHEENLMVRRCVGAWRFSNNKILVDNARENAVAQQERRSFGCR
jgi:hypothetical protein